MTDQFTEEEKSDIKRVKNIIRLKMFDYLEPKVKSYLQNFVDPFIYKSKIKNNFIGLYFFMKYLDLNFYNN